MAFLLTLITKDTLQITYQKKIIFYWSIPFFWFTVNMIGSLILVILFSGVLFTLAKTLSKEDFNKIYGPLTIVFLFLILMF